MFGMRIGYLANCPMKLRLYDIEEPVCHACSPTYGVESVLGFKGLSIAIGRNLLGSQTNRR
jgi:hypothetical protein